MNITNLSKPAQNKTVRKKYILNGDEVHFSTTFQITKGISDKKDLLLN